MNAREREVERVDRNVRSGYGSEAVDLSGQRLILRVPEAERLVRGGARIRVHSARLGRAEDVVDDDVRQLVHRTVQEIGVRFRGLPIAPAEYERQTQNESRLRFAHRCFPERLISNTTGLSLLRVTT